MKKNKDGDYYNKYIISDKIAKDFVDSVISNSKIKDFDNKEELLEFISKKQNIDSINNIVNNANAYEQYFNNIKDIDINYQRKIFADKINSLEHKKIKNISTKKLMIPVAAAIIALSLWVFHMNNTPENNIDTNIAEENSLIIKPKIIGQDGMTLNYGKYFKNNDNMALCDTTLLTSTAVCFDIKDTISNSNAGVGIEYNTLIVPAGYSFKIKLADQTEVTLNANSKMKYPTNFVGDSRVVEITGEAFFNVTKSDKPFIVKSRGDVIKVYGTQFNVRQYDNDKLETILVHGSVGVTTENGEEVMMSQNERFYFNNEKNQYLCHKVIVEEYLGWIEDRFIYNKTNINRVIQDLEKWYNVSFNYNKELLNDKKINLNTSKHESLAEIINVIKVMCEISIINEGDGTYSIK